MKYQQQYPIPVLINLIIISTCSALYFLLLYAGSRANSTGIMLLLGLGFAIVMIPVYSLIHEAEHGLLHPNAKINNLFGMWLCLLFIVSFSFFRHCHLKHHKKNRTDSEMWDLYYEHQNKWLRYGNLYLMMIGFGYMALWLSVVLFAFAPRLVYSGLLQKHTEIKGFLAGSDQKGKLRSFQLESLAAIVFQLLCFWTLHLNLLPWLVTYLIHGFVWSSQNYVNHAFSPRDIINGAHNLKTPFWSKIIYLNFNVHLAHHQNPKVPWVHLPHFIKADKNRISFFKNYLRLWKGPEMSKERSPREADLILPDEFLIKDYEKQSTHLL